MDLAPFRVHHYGDGVALLLVEPPDQLDDAAVPLPRAVAHVDPRHVHPAHRERLQLLRPARGGADGAHELRAPRAPEPVLLQLGLRHRVHLDGRRVAGGRGPRNHGPGPIVRHQDARGRRGLRVAVGRGGSDGEAGEGGCGGGGQGAECGGEGRPGVVVGFAQESHARRAGEQVEGLRRHGSISGGGEGGGGSEAVVIAPEEEEESGDDGSQRRSF